MKYRAYLHAHATAGLRFLAGAVWSCAWSGRGSLRACFIGSSCLGSALLRLRLFGLAAVCDGLKAALEAFVRILAMFLADRAGRIEVEVVAAFLLDERILISKTSKEITEPPPERVKAFFVGAIDSVALDDVLGDADLGGHKPLCQEIGRQGLRILQAKDFGELGQQPFTALGVHDAEIALRR